jgi:hypothetical protein
LAFSVGTKALSFLTSALASTFSFEPGTAAFAGVIGATGTGEAPKDGIDAVLTGADEVPEAAAAGVDAVRAGAEADGINPDFSFTFFSI